ncbi:hypothetical protein [Nocardia tengchongensis]
MPGWKTFPFTVMPWSVNVPPDASVIAGPDDFGNLSTSASMVSRWMYHPS